MPNAIIKAKVSIEKQHMLRQHIKYVVNCQFFHGWLCCNGLDFLLDSYTNS